MRLPKRWRWWLLLGGLCLALVGALGALLLEWPAPDRVRLAFGRVQLGMTTTDVNAVMMELGRLSGGRGGILLPEEQFPNPVTLDRNDYAMSYEFESGQITVVFRNDRAVFKSSARRYIPNRTIWDKMRGFLNRVRAAVGL